MMNDEKNVLSPHDVASGPTLKTPKKKSRIGTFIFTIGSIAVAGGVGWLVWSYEHAAPPVHHGRRAEALLANNDAPVSVVATTAQKGDMPVTLNGLGTVTSLAAVTVRTQLSGYLTSVGFTEGQIVKKGDFLAQIDQRTYQIALSQAQGQLLHDMALMKDAEIDLARFTKLSAQDSIAKQQVDTQQSLVQQDQGTVAADQAMVDNAKLNIDYCHIISPITGRVGLRQVDAGNYVQANDTNGIVVVTQLQPISVIFSLPEDDLPLLMRRVQGNATLPVTVFDRSQSRKLATGTLSTVDNQIDITTGTVKLRASFDNNDNALFPNQFVNATLLADTLHDAIIIPVAAVQHGAPGAYVYAVKSDNTVEVRPVTVGPSAGDNVAITAGLTAGEQVVVDGVDKLRDGAKVTVTLSEGQNKMAAHLGTAAD
ncbi:MAG: MdtA/MuxA family multidrug efflux RND transporter periplasmic adaptor subunit [Dongiaceae bacterium]